MDPRTEARNRIIVALDVESLEKAIPFVEELREEVGCFKVGLELLHGAGTPETLDFFGDLGTKIFFDGKFNDIPTTVAKASRAIQRSEVAFFDVHACSGIEAMRAAVENRGRSAVLAVTVLTSFNSAGCEHTFGESLPVVLNRFFQDAITAGVQGVICSPQDLKLLNSIPQSERLLKVTPGVRPEWAEVQDQRRAVTPAQAIAAGATHLVIGRPILSPPSHIGSPRDAARRIVDEIEEALGA